MLTIWKFPVHAADEFTLTMPRGARLLDVQTQLAEPCLWAMVDDAEPKVSRRFAVRGTGHDASGLAGVTYVGTFQLTSGRLIFHLFDRGES